MGCAVLFLLPPLYVFGLGPAAWLVSIYPGAEDLVGTVYYPLQFAADNSELIDRALRWYVGFGI
ncbi:MAG: hypothetical protein IAF94_17455 [Pirellulaceae bacterium]|nr:hypothetical protein [Pirellulaceae bacterium]